MSGEGGNALERVGGRFPPLPESRGVEGLPLSFSMCSGEHIILPVKVHDAILQIEFPLIPKK